MGSTTAQLYRNVYAFSLAELHTIDSLQKEGVKGAIYGATAGTALLALPQALRKIEDRLEEIFRPRGQKQEINRRLTELDSITEALRGAFQGIRQYDEACTQLDQTQTRIVEEQNVLSRLRSEAVTVAAYVQLWPEWIRLQECAAELEGLPLVVESFPENGLGQLEIAREGLRARQEHLHDLEDKRTTLCRDAAGLAVDPQLIAQAEGISVLAERRSQYSAACEDLPLKQQKRGGIDREIADLLRRLGPRWTEAQVRQTDCSVVAREAIRGHAGALDGARAEVARTEQDVASRQEVHEVAASDEQTARQKAEQFSDLEPVDEALVRELQTGRALFREAAHDLPGVEVDLNRARTRVEEGIREIDARWTLNNVSQFDVSIAAQRKVQEFARRFDEARKALDKADSRRVAAHEMLRGSREQHAALLREFEELPKDVDREEVAQRKAALIGLRDALHERAQCASETQHSQSRLDDKRQELARLKAPLVSPLAPPRWLWLVILLVAVATLVAGLAIGKLPEVAIGAAVLAAFGVLGWAWSRVVRTKSADARRAHAEAVAQVQQEIGVLEADLERLRRPRADRDGAITKHAGVLSLSASPSPEEIRAAEEALERDRDTLETCERLEGELRKHADNVQQRERHLSDAERVVEERGQDLEAVNRDWGTYLSGLGLAPDNAVETVHLIFAKLSALRDQIGELRSKEERIGRMSASRDKYLALARRVPALAPHCDGAPADLLSAVDRFFEDVQKQHERLQERELARRTLADERRRVSATAEALQKAQEALATTKEQHRVVQEAWAGWLGQHGLAVDLSPPTALEALQLIENAVDRMTERQQLDEAIADLQSRAAAYEANAAAVFGALQRRVPESADLPARIAELGRELESNKHNAARQQEMQRQVESLAGQVESARHQVEEAVQHIASLLKEGDATDEDTFRERGKWYVRRNELHASIDQAESTIRKVSGEIDLDALKAKLAATSREQLEVRRQETELGITDAENQVNGLRDSKADLTNKIDSMKTADTVARLRADEERVRAEILPLALQWTRLAIAKRLLLHARKKFEEEQQPKVVRDAAEFFAAMTCGRFAKVIAPVGADTIEVVTAGGERRKPEELSRGTAEQLYLALRFGYIRLRAADHERPPVVMDDILVNFDPQRAAEAAAAILKLAGEHQVLFFTCHPETVARFRQQDASLRVYQLQAGVISVEIP
ncbi:MAG: hypothetical protein V2A79_00880 [Planctomycetota bacterium]